MPSPELTLTSPEIARENPDSDSENACKIDSDSQSQAQSKAKTDRATKPTDRQKEKAK